MPVTLAQAERAKAVVAEHYAPHGIVGIGVSRIREDYVLIVDLETEPRHAPPPPASVDPVQVVINCRQRAASLLGFAGEDDD